MAGVPLGHVLVSDVRAVNISGSDCLTALLWITGVDGVCVGMQHNAWIRFLNLTKTFGSHIAAVYELAKIYLSLTYISRPFCKLQEAFEVNFLIL